MTTERLDEEHPILVCDIVRKDGSHGVALRVFCAREQQSVPLSRCEVCPSTLDITAGGSGASGRVRCVRAPTHEVRAPTHEGTAVGGVLSESILCVGSDVSVVSVIALFVERALADVFVVDDDGRLVGLIREINFVRSRPSEGPRYPFAEPTPRPALTAGEIMSSAIPICEDIPVRRAILRMAHSHLRDAAIVTRAGELLGVLGDLQGLRWISAQARLGR